MENFDNIRKLVALKRYETPGEDYFERFIDEFHRRQRAEMLRLSARRLFWDRLDTWLSGWNGRKWLVGAAAATCCGAVLAFIVFDQPSTDLNPGFQGALAVEDIDPSSLLREF